MIATIIYHPHIISNLRMSNINPHLATLPGICNAGQKPGNRGRRGSRTNKSSTIQNYNPIVRGEYIIILRSNRQKVYNGCKAQFIKESHVLRHNCALPYPHENIITGTIETRIGSAANHHFHMSKWCVLRSTHHSNFNGMVQVDPNVAVTNVLKQALIKGELVPKNWNFKTVHSWYNLSCCWCQYHIANQFCSGCNKSLNAVVFAAAAVESCVISLWVASYITWFVLVLYHII